MALRLRRCRTGPGPTLTSLALLAVVLMVAYIYYETPLIQAGADPAALPPDPPQPAWTTDLPEAWATTPPGDLVLSVGERHILVARLTSQGLEAVWYDRFGFAAAQTGPAPLAGPLMAVAGLLAGAIPPGDADPSTGPVGPRLRLVDVQSLPAGRTWAPAQPTAGMAPVALAAGRLLAVAAFGAPSGPDLAPDRLLALDLGDAEPQVSWSQSYDSWRLVQAAGGPAGLASLAVNPADGRFRVELWSWQGDRLWESEPSDEPLHLLAVGPAAGGEDGSSSGPPRAHVLAGGSTLMSLGPGGPGRALELASPPQGCWPVGSGAACIRAGTAGQDGELVFLTGGGRVTRHPVAYGATAWPWPGRGVLVAAGDPGGAVTAYDAAGARWTLELPLMPQVLATGADGLAVSDGRRLAWLHWPAGGRR